METPAPSGHFIRQIIDADRAAGKHGGLVVTRFPPEPNGYLHIGHAKSICLNFGLAQAYGGRCHLRFDDTNPVTEEVEYVESIQQDVAWLGFDWGEHLYFASDYFGKMYAWGEELIRRGKAYVCTLTPEQFKEYRGVPSRPGKPSPWRDRPAGESLDLFRRMQAGEFPDGAYVLRAKIDMASPNIHLRDPVIYRIRKVPHHRSGDRWNVYPMYDYAHCLEDSVEQITHSICTLEFEVHRPLYDWILDALELFHPQQIEFARLNLTYTVMSKRKLLELVREGLVEGWDDPRLPTLCGMRRRGVPPAAIRTFCEKIGVTKYESLTDVALLEHCIRDELNRTAVRRMAVLQPLKLVLTNVGEDEVLTCEAVNNPEDPEAGTRPLAFGRNLLIEADDFMEDPAPKYFRLGPGRAVRLRYAGVVRCTGFTKDAGGKVVEVLAEWDRDRTFETDPATPRIRATIHWVSARDAVPLETRLYDRLFTVENPAGETAEPEEGEEAEGPADYKRFLNPDSVRTVTAHVEPTVADLPPGASMQFERIGYFCVDTRASQPGRPVLNRTATLKDTWAKQSGKG